MREERGKEDLVDVCEAYYVLLGIRENSVEIVLVTSIIKDEKSNLILTNILDSDSDLNLVRRSKGSVAAGFYEINYYETSKRIRRRQCNKLRRNLNQSYLPS